VLIGQSATTDERLRVRTNHPFADAFSPDALDSLLEMGPPHFVPRVDVSRLTQTIHGQLGDGKVAWLPTLTPTSTVQWQRDPYFPFRIVLPEEVRPPAEAAELIQMVKAVAPQPFAVEVEAPKHVMAEYRRDDNRFYVHLVNLATDAPARDVTLHVNEPVTGEATVYPMDGKAFSVEPRAAGKGRRIDLDVLDRYALVEIAIE